jgi:predicted permease
MSTFKYLTVVVAVLAVAFFLSHNDETNTFVVSSYAGIMPTAISALPMSLPKNWGG